MSNVKNIVLDQGSSYTYTFTLTDGMGAVFNLTGYDARMQVRRTYGDSTILLNATVANAKLAINTVLGTVTLDIAPADTNTIRFNEKDDDTLECVYDLEIVSSTGRVYKPAKGTFTLNREVSR